MTGPTSRSATTADLFLLLGAAASLGVTALASARWGAITLGCLFLVGVALRRRGIPSLLLTQRRERTDLLVLGAFGVILIALALVLP